MCISTSGPSGGSNLACPRSTPATVHGAAPEGHHDVISSHKHTHTHIYIYMCVYTYFLDAYFTLYIHILHYGADDDDDGDGDGGGGGDGDRHDDDDVDDDDDIFLGIALCKETAVRDVVPPRRTKSLRVINAALYMITDDKPSIERFLFYASLLFNAFLTMTLSFPFMSWRPNLPDKHT